MSHRPLFNKNFNIMVTTVGPHKIRYITESVMATVVAELSEAMGVAGQQSGKDVEV
jgi:hypothetical protein